MAMDTIPLYHAEIEELSERRVTLWNSLSQGRDPAVVEEITADVLYGDRSLVWDQAENRLHVYKAVLALTVR